jgi:hypothetical protein
VPGPRAEGWAADDPSAPEPALPLTTHGHTGNRTFPPVAARGKPDGPAPRSLGAVTSLTRA